MSQPTPYTQTTDFSQQEANNASGRSTVNTAALDAEFAAIDVTLDQTLANIQLLQRDDGKLADLTVELHTLSPEVLNLIGGYSLRGLWTTATEYYVNDIVSNGEYTYVCTVAHTSGVSFDGTKFIQFGFTNGTDAAIAAANAQASANAAASSEASAALSAAAALASEVATDVSEAAALASQIAAAASASSSASSATSSANSAAEAAVSAATISIPLSIANGGTGNTSSGAALTALGGVASTTLAASSGSNSVGFIQTGTGAVATTAQAKMREIVSRTDYNSDANFNAAKVGKVSVDSANRFRSTAFVAGDEEFVSPTTRDAFIVGRDLDGDTNCHAFADRTVINNVTDAGLYGAFDATTELYGSHAHNHVYSFQDRVKYRGTGTLTNSTGFYSSTLHSGTGTITNRYGMQIDEMAKTGGGVITNQIGILINPLTTGSNNVGLNIAQTTGWSLYAPGGAKSYHEGQIGFGLEPIAGVQVDVDGGTAGGSAVGVRIQKTNGYSIYSLGTGKSYFGGNVGVGVDADGTTIPFKFAGPSGCVGYQSTDATNAYVGVIGDNNWNVVTNGSIRLTVDLTTYHFHPGGDNTQNCGTATKRWGTVYAGTGAINTSDAREKQQVRELSDKEKAVAVKCKSLIRAFKFNEAVELKGDAARIHFGVMAQDVKAAFESEGLIAEDYAVLCYDEWEGGNRYGVRYDELLAFIISAL